MANSLKDIALGSPALIARLDGCAQGFQLGLIFFLILFKLDVSRGHRPSPNPTLNLSLIVGNIIHSAVDFTP